MYNVVKGCASKILMKRMALPEAMKVMHSNLMKSYVPCLLMWQFMACLSIDGSGTPAPPVAVQSKVFQKNFVRGHLICRVWKAFQNRSDFVTAAQSVLSAIRLYLIVAMNIGIYFWVYFIF